MLARQDYPLNCDEHLLSPCLLLYRAHVAFNLREMLRIAGDPLRLRPHAKTHKCGELIRLEVQQGIVKHKCATLQESMMLAEHGASQVLLAYPLVGPNVRAVLELIARFPATQFSVVADNCKSVQELEQVIATNAAQLSSRLPLNVFIDIDSGMHRTGVQAGPAAIAVAQAVHQAPSLRLAGLHVYDGQNHQPSLVERQTAVAELLQPVWELVRHLNTEGIRVDTLVCGGTPTFPVFASVVVPADLLAFNALSIELSPGTCVLHDFNYGRDYADMANFRPAAVLLCRVVSKPGPDLLTVDLGYKAVAPDSPAGRRAHFIDLPDAEQIQHSEEHLVLRTNKASDFDLGRCLLAIPAHVCPTVALYSHFHVINEDGQLAASWPISRGRQVAIA